jgi:hypothetical protein
MFLLLFRILLIYIANSELELFQGLSFTTISSTGPTAGKFQRPVRVV